MFEIIFLNVSDALFYQKHDFSQQVTDVLEESLSPYMVYISGPKKFSSEEELPIFIGLKENSIDNKEINTKRNGYFIFSNVVTAEIHLNKVYENDKFRPVEKGKNIVRPAGASLDYVPLKTTSYDAKYISIPRNKLPSRSGKWALFEHSGSFISNVHRLEIESSNSSENNSSQTIDPISSRMNIGFESSNLSPTVPSNGISLSSSKASTSNQHIVIYGSFSLDKKVDISSGFLPVNLIVTGGQFENLELITLKIPNEKIDLSSDKRRGYFSLDIMPLFYSQEYGNRTLKDSFYITAVSGATVSKVLPITTK